MRVPYNRVCFVRVIAPGEVAERHRKKVLFDTAASVCFHDLMAHLVSRPPFHSHLVEMKNVPYKNCCPLSGDALSSDALALTEPFGIGVVCGDVKVSCDCPMKKHDSNLVDSASSHTLVSKIKPCMSKYKEFYSETANGSLYQL